VSASDDDEAASPLANGLATNGEMRRVLADPLSRHAWREWWDASGSSEDLRRIVDVVSKCEHPRRDSGTHFGDAPADPRCASCVSPWPDRLRR
jgi:hypothetical protein